MVSGSLSLPQRRGGAAGAFAFSARRRRDAPRTTRRGSGHNMQHTARAKSVSFKTRHERANFLRHFFRELDFRELESRGGSKIASDSRNLGQRHIQAVVDLWRKDGLKPSTIQTYLSFLRGLAG
jgi:hypothetical protein